jgi:hypothetical protein
MLYYCNSEHILHDSSPAMLFPTCHGIHIVVCVLTPHNVTSWYSVHIQTNCSCQRVSWPCSSRKQNTTRSRSPCRLSLARTWRLCVARFHGDSGPRSCAHYTSFPSHFFGSELRFCVRSERKSQFFALRDGGSCKWKMLHNCSLGLYGASGAVNCMKQSFCKASSRSASQEIPCIL